jgi:small subunit ribosomal protein S13
MGKGKPRVRDEKKEEEKKIMEEEKKRLRELRKTAKEKKEVKVERHIVRICETNIDGTKKLRQGLLQIKGIGQSLALVIPQAANLDPEMRVGNLTDEQVELLEEVIKNPLKYGIPEFLLNRRKDPFTGEIKHLTASDLIITTKTDIDFLKRIRCYRGIRHELGLPVRGQRTRSTFRKGRTVGVQRRKK